MTRGRVRPGGEWARQRLRPGGECATGWPVSRSLEAGGAGRAYRFESELSSSSMSDIRSRRCLRGTDGLCHDFLADLRSQTTQCDQINALAEDLLEEVAESADPEEA